MEELIPVGSRKIGDETIPTVNAKELHCFLGSRQEFRHWIKDRISQYDFVKNQDFATSENFIRGGKAVNYHITLDMAKELSMVERTKKGKQARQYFIECEKKLKSLQYSVDTLPDFTNSIIAARAWADEREARDLAETKVRALIPVIQEQTRMIETITPKAEQFDAFMDGQNYKSINLVAKALGTGQNRLFKKLKEEKILLRTNAPYQEYIEKGYFVVKEKTIKKGDKIINYSKTLVTAKGESFLWKLLKVNSIGLPFMEGYTNAS